MKAITKMLVGMAFLIVISTIGLAAIPVPNSEMVFEEKVLVTESNTEINNYDFNRLQINPKFEHFELKAGMSESDTIKVKNTGESAIMTDVRIEIPAYTEYLMDPGWVTVTPEGGEIRAGETKEFKVTVNVPDNAERGYYSAEIVFTNDSLPSAPYELYPKYVNSMQLSVNVWIPPVIKILNPYIQDQVETGKEYDYEIKLKNIGTDAVSIDPQIDDSNRYQIYGPYEQGENTIEADDITITSPKKIDAGETGIVKVNVKVPHDASGYFSGSIDLNIDDLSIDEWGGMVQLSLQIWKQPTEPYVKTFNLDSGAPISIDVSSSLMDNGFLYSMAMSKSGSIREPGFDVKITGPSGKASDVKPSKTVIEGVVYLGSSDMFPPWESDSEGLYRDSYNYIETYELDGTEGEWELSILPRNTTMFQYKIQIGE